MDDQSFKNLVRSGVVINKIVSIHSFNVMLRLFKKMVFSFVDEVKIDVFLVVNTIFRKFLLNFNSSMELDL